MVYYVTEVGTNRVLMELAIKLEKQIDNGYIQMQTDICDIDKEEMWCNESLTIGTFS